MTLPLDYAPGQQNQSRFGRGLIGWVMFLAIAALLFVWLKQQSPGAATIPLSKFYKEVQVTNVARLTVDGDEILGTFRSPVTYNGMRLNTFRVYLPSGMGATWAFNQWIMDNSGGAEVRVAPANNLLTNFILPFIPWLLVIAFIYIFVFRQLRRQQRTGPLPVVVVNPEDK